MKKGWGVGAERDQGGTHEMETLHQNTSAEAGGDNSIFTKLTSSHWLGLN